MKKYDLAVMCGILSSLESLQELIADIVGEIGGVAEDDDYIHGELAEIADKADSATRQLGALASHIEEGLRKEKGDFCPDGEKKEKSNG